MTTKLIERPNSKLWLAAIKPPMYSVAVIPISVGTAIAFAETQTINSSNFSTFLMSAILIIAWLNLSNDVFDSETGIDKNKAHSLVNLTGNKALIFGLANLFLAVGVSGICAISWWQKDPTVILLVVLCCALGYTYQGPPFRLGYQGLGEIICFFTFGPLAFAAAYYSQTQTWSATNFAASAIVGITTSIILFCSHFHQIADDLAAGKKSPIVPTRYKERCPVVGVVVRQRLCFDCAICGFGNVPNLDAVDFWEFAICDRPLPPCHRLSQPTDKGQQL
ncbi:2-carboxy-1,4-naphthoquinone phytyltransferase [Microcoleus vaginatus]|uniref:2-carboxy-1,4-naphthoquinone phytyltransferase n=1 Tax=Microcoleus vaginatus TaxID=119532 RepID=UPI00403F6AAD